MNIFKNIYFLSILIVVLIIIISYLALRLNVLQQNNYKLKDESDKYQFINSGIKLNIIQQFRGEDYNFDNLELIYLRSGSKRNLFDLIEHEPKLVLYISENSCSSCRNQELKNIKEFCEELGNNNALLFVSNSSNNISESINIDYIDTYFINEKDWKLPVEPPTLFVINSTYKATNVFKPTSDMPLLSLDYYSVIKEKYFKK